MQTSHPHNVKPVPFRDIIILEKYTQFGCRQQVTKCFVIALQQCSVCSAYPTLEMAVIYCGAHISAVYLFLIFITPAFVTDSLLCCLFFKPSKLEKYKFALISMSFVVPRLKLRYKSCRVKCDSPICLSRSWYYFWYFANVVYLRIN